MYQHKLVGSCPGRVFSSLMIIAYSDHTMEIQVKSYSPSITSHTLLSAWQMDSTEITKNNIFDCQNDDLFNEI